MEDNKCTNHFIYLYLSLLNAGKVTTKIWKSKNKRITETDMTITIEVDFGKVLSYSCHSINDNSHLVIIKN